MTTPPVIDAHVHIFPPRMITDRDALLQRDTWFREAFGHPLAKMRWAEELIASMDRARIDVSVIVGWPWQHNSDCAEHNDYLAASAARWPDRLVWLGIVNPVASGADAEIDRCIALGAHGFGEINADAQGFQWSLPDEWRAPLERIAAASLPVMIHTSEPVGHTYPGKGVAHPQDVLSAIMAVPDLIWVLAHWGGGMPFYELMPEVRAACVNVAYDSAATSYLYDTEVFRHVSGLVGAGKVLFGSDWPVLNQTRLLERIRALPFDENARVSMLGGNAARIYRIG